MLSARNRPRGSSEQAVAVAVPCEPAKPQRLFRLACLTDKPLADLDDGTRARTCAEIRELQRQLGVTTIYFTHDQAEALALGERVAVLGNGRLQQLDEPERLYERPANTFVAGLIGSPAMNLFEARLSWTGDGLTAGLGEHRLVVDAELVAERPALLRLDGASVTLGIRPEDLDDAAFAADFAPQRTLEAVASSREALGSEVLVRCSLAKSGSSFAARLHARTAARVGEALRLVVDTKRLHFFDLDSGVAIDGGRLDESRLPARLAPLT